MVNASWTYYNHALLSTQRPWESAKIQDIDWHINGGYPYFARWTSDFDCGHETEWWYCIKDTAFNMSAVKSKVRNQIKNAQKNFEVKVINALDYAEELIYVMKKAFETYPSSYRPNFDGFDERQRKHLEEQAANGLLFFAAFDKETNTLSGFTSVKENDLYAELIQQKCLPDSEKKKVNFALIYGICEYYKEHLCARGGYMIIDGQRNTFHKTNFHDFLIRNFDFRKAYCVLHIKYRMWVKGVIFILYPFRKIFAHSENRFLTQISAVLMMEEFRRTFKSK